MKDFLLPSVFIYLSESKQENELILLICKFDLILFIKVLVQCMKIIESLKVKNYLIILVKRFEIKNIILCFKFSS